MSKPFRIITRESRLSMWQASFVASILQRAGHACEIIPVTSTGDTDRTTPLYEMGVEGVFTKELDTALLDNIGDIAVHSLKDVPITPAAGLTIAAVAERGDHEDLLFAKPGFDPEKSDSAVIATCSIRRIAQWQKKFPGHTLVSVRGNVDTRISKFRDSSWDGMILAKAGVVRLGYNLGATIPLPWMLPAPAQGAIGVMCRVDDVESAEALSLIDHVPTRRCVMVEREFLRHLHGGCSAPISGFAWIEDGQIQFEGAVHSKDGTACFEVRKHFPLESWKSAGLVAAEVVMKSSTGSSILEEIQRSKTIVAGNE